MFWRFFSALLLLLPTSNVSWDSRLTSDKADTSVPGATADCAAILWLDRVASEALCLVRRLGIAPEDWFGGRVADSDPEVATTADARVPRLLDLGAPVWAVITDGVTSGAVGTVVNVPPLWKLPASVTDLAWPGVSRKSWGADCRLPWRCTSSLGWTQSSCLGRHGVTEGY